MCFSHDNSFIINLSGIKILAVFLYRMYIFWHYDVIDCLCIFLTEFTFTNKQALLAHAIVVFFFKAFVAHNHRNLILHGIMTYFYPPICHQNLSEHGSILLKKWSKMVDFKKYPFFLVYARKFNPLLFPDSQA